ncbi:MAG: ABC transporter ATP-binding protein, partial [Clostridia bacterium]|nr:ABC transporter ATP-binding protein [Clostridia bacterium]
MSEFPLLRLEGVNMDFGEGKVLKDMDLDVGEGEFLTLLGPSGCGKTTTLRIIAGMQRPSVGKVFLNGRDITDLPPEKRDVNTVFQSYALFPHMNVFQNVAYGLKVRHTPRDEIKRRVAEALELVSLSGFEKRMPTQLSGGQRQRVAIARALVPQPRILLMDEPLGALDMQLRRRMQTELKNLQKSLGKTFVYVTHDQEEALNMSTRVVVMQKGKIMQMGSPDDVYERPENLFVAGFIGRSNLLRGTVSELCGDKELLLDVAGIKIPAMESGRFNPSPGDPAAICLRPQRVKYSSSPVFGMDIKGLIVDKEYLDGMQRTSVKLNDEIIISVLS